MDMVQSMPAGEQMGVLASGGDGGGIGFKIFSQDGVYLDFPRVPSAFGVVVADNELWAHTARANHVAFEERAGFVNPRPGIEADPKQSAIALLDKTLTKQQRYFFGFQYFRLTKAVDFHTILITLGYYTFLAYQPTSLVFRDPVRVMMKSYRWMAAG